MTGDAGDARTEAERIVMAAVEATPDDPYPHEDRLVAALAAAIRVDETSGSGLDYALEDLSAALSALRARDGEETG